MLDELEGEILVAQITGDDPRRILAHRPLEGGDRGDVRAGIVPNRLDVLDLARRGSGILDRDEVAEQTIGRRDDDVERRRQPRGCRRRENDKPLLEAQQLGDRIGDRLGDPQVAHRLEDHRRRVDLDEHLLTGRRRLHHELAIPRLPLHLNGEGAGEAAAALLRIEPTEDFKRHHRRVGGMPLHRRLVGPHLGPPPRSARGLHPPRHPHPVDLVPDIDVGWAPFHEYRRGPRADGHLENLLRFLNPLGGQGPLEAPLVVVARLAPGGLEGEWGESLDRLDLGLDLDAELGHKAGEEAAHVAAGEDLVRLPHLGVVLRTVDKRRDEPGQRHDHLAGD